MESEKNGGETDVSSYDKFTSRAHGNEKEYLINCRGVESG